nr:plasmid mobilization relaxosome protein MobC [uncultured Oscillibacter sp.]
MFPKGGNHIAGQAKKHHLHIELTQKQYRRLTEQAKACGLSKRAYLVRIMEGNPIRAKPSQEIKNLRWEVHKIGVNINQIARSVNAGIARAADARRGLLLLDQVYELMYEVAKK